MRGAPCAAGRISVAEGRRMVVPVRMRVVAGMGGASDDEVGCEAGGDHCCSKALVDGQRQSVVEEDPDEGMMEDRQGNACGGEEIVPPAEAIEMRFRPNKRVVHSAEAGCAWDWEVPSLVGRSLDTVVRAAQGEDTM